MSWRPALGQSRLLFNEYRSPLREGVKLTTHHQLRLRSRKHGSIHPLPHVASWRSAELSTETALLFTFTSRGFYPSDAVEVTLKPAVTFEGRHMFVTGGVSTSNRVEQGLTAVFKISLLLSLRL
jgi:hypothetical protein